MSGGRVFETHVMKRLAGTTIGTDINADSVIIYASSNFSGRAMALFCKWTYDVS